MRLAARHISQDASSASSLLPHQARQRASPLRSAVSAKARAMQFHVPTLCLVTDRLRCNGRRIEDVVDAAVDGRVGLVQLREKDLPAAELYALALRLKDVVGRRALLFVNDRVDIALAANADGVQLGENALPLEAARQIAGDRVRNSLLLGRSVHSVAGALKAEAQGADLLVLGTIFPTDSHPGAVTGGSRIVREVASAVSRAVPRHRRHRCNKRW